MWTQKILHPLVVTPAHFGERAILMYTVIVIG